MNGIIFTVLKMLAKKNDQGNSCEHVGDNP